MLIRRRSRPQQLPLLLSQYFYKMLSLFAVIDLASIYFIILIYHSVTINMAEQQNNVDQYQVIIVECCQNCESHQSFSRHSEWKYFQQFNELKRKLERFVNNAIVVKNPIPDELIKPSQARLSSNSYINKDTNQTVVFPRVGAFEVYIYNILIYSKLLSNSWPNHYKLIQIITKIIQQKNKGNTIHEFSVFQQTNPIEQTSEKQIKKLAVSKKKKKDYRVYKSKDKTILNQSRIKKSNLDPIQESARKKNRRTLFEKDRDGNQQRKIQNKNQNRVKLPSLRNTINFKDQQSEEDFKKQISSQKYQKQRFLEEKQDSLRKIFNSIQQFQKSQKSIVRKGSITEDNHFNSLLLQRNQSLEMKQSPQDDQQMKILEDRSVQYSERGQLKDFMNRYVQYEQQEGFLRDYGLQIDDGSLPKQKNSHFVQTEKIQLFPLQKAIVKPYMLDQQVQANIIISKNEKEVSIQTHQKQYSEIQTNTELKVTISRLTQFPQQQVQSQPKDELNIIDSSFVHLFQKRRNIPDNQYYSIDKFEEKSTKYKWIGRAQEKISIHDLRRNFLYECLVFSFYNYFGIKTPEKRLSFQACSNVVVEQKNTKMINTALVHVMTSDNPQIQNIFQFQQYDSENRKYPLSQILTFKKSKQQIKFTNYGGLLALAHFIGDFDIYDQERCFIGLVISNQQVKQIYKLSADQYLPSKSNLVKNLIQVQRKNVEKEGLILLERASKQVETQFISMLTKLVDQQVFSQLLKYLQQAFIHQSPTHKTFKNSLLSMKTEKIDENIVLQFINMIKQRRELVLQKYKGQIYSFIKYRSLQPKLEFHLQNYKKKLVKQSRSTNLHHERKFLYNEKIVLSSQVQKHIRNKDTFVIIHGESGIGKTCFIEDIGKNLDLKYGDKLKIKPINKNILFDQNLINKKADQILDQYRKQVIIIDDAEYYYPQIITLVEKIYSKSDPRTKPQISFCLATSSQATKLKIRLSILGIQVVHCSMMALEAEQIRNYMMKVIQFHSYTSKKNFLQEILGVENSSFSDSHPKYNFLKILRNPFYLQIYSYYLDQVEDLSDLDSCLFNKFTRFSILKQVYKICWNRHVYECKEMQVKFEDCLHDIRKIAFEYYLNNLSINQAIKETINKYKSTDIIINQLVFYPVNLEAIIKKEKDLFIHRQYFYYFLAEAYCYYMQKSYRNLSMNKLYYNWQLLSLVNERYKIEKTYSKLIQVIQKSRKYKNTWEQASNSITLLIKISFIFSNYNFDEVQIPDADLTGGVFYNCSFRGANLNNAVLYKTQMISCLVDNAIMDNINLFQKKYQIQYTVVAAAMSIDGKNIALGCGNYLIILQTDTGKELKKIEAHLDIIRSVKYSKDNNTLITIADDKTLRMWDTRSFRSVVFKLPQKGTISFSSETDMIASVAKNTLKVWNIKSMANQFVLEGHSDLITTLQFSSDGNHIATGSRDTTIRIWSTKNGQLSKTFKGHSEQIITLKISPFKKTVVSSSKDKDIIVWGFQNAGQILKKKFSDEITEICLDQKQKFLIVSLSKQNYVTILNLQNLQVAHLLQGHKGKIVSLNFDVNFKKLISLGRDKTVKVWDFDKIMEIQQKQNFYKKKTNLRLVKGPILSLAFDKKNQKYITSHKNGEINIFSALDNRHVDQLISHNGAVNCLQVDKTGKIYSAGSDGKVRVWNLLSKREPKIFDMHSSEVIQLKLNQKNRIIATSSVTQELVIIDFTGINIVMSTREEGRVESIQFNKQQKIMAVGGTEKYIALYQIGQGGNSINRMEELGPNSDSVVCMVFHGDSYIVVALKNGHIAIWNHLRSTLAKKIENNSIVTSLLTFHKKYVCFSSQDGKLRVVDMDEGKQIKIYRNLQKCTNFLTNSDQTLLYSSTDSGNIILWNLRNLRESHSKIEFDRIAFDEEGLRVVQIEGFRSLLIRDLHYHEQQYLEVKQINDDIEGVTYYQGKIILLLKNGIHWELGRKQFSFGKDQSLEGDLYWVRDRSLSAIYKTALKKLKGLKKPIQAVLEDLSY